MQVWRVQVTVKELIEALEKLPQDMPVLGQSETSTWDIEPSELVPSANVSVCHIRDGKGKFDTYPQALILGHIHPRAYLVQH